MSFRSDQIADFLARANWGGAGLTPMEADFSSRRYARLTKSSGDTAILMDAEDDQKTSHFVVLAKILRQAHVHAPEIYAADPDQGLVLMQDLGARNVGALLDAGEPSRPYYLRAAEVLARVHRGIDKAALGGLDLPRFDAALFTGQTELFLDAYVPFVARRAVAEEGREAFRTAWTAALRPLDDLPQNLLLRDFMPDNLMDLAQGGLGVLDFQDAGMGPVAYDLASLCEEVRRNGGYAMLGDVVTYYREMMESPLSQGELVQACAVLSAQRHMRVLGIVARLAAQGRSETLAFIPRIRHHLRHILKEPCLGPVSAWVRDYGGTAL